MHRRQRRRTWGRSKVCGTTLIETVIVAGLSVVVAAGIYTTFNLISSFTKQGFTETRLINRTSIAIENISRTLNHAYRPDSDVAANRPVIANGQSVDRLHDPDQCVHESATAAALRQATSTLHHERQLPDGSFVEISGASLLTDVESFFITNQEGILSFVVTVSADLGAPGRSATRWWADRCRGICRGREGKGDEIRAGSEKRGTVLVFALIAVVLISVSMIPVAQYVRQTARLAFSTRGSDQAFYAAEAGVARTLSYIFAVGTGAVTGIYDEQFNVTEANPTYPFGQDWHTVGPV
jgi:uncharacterized protein (UPF0333 family)